MHIETKTRAVVKAVSWRIMATLITSSLVFIITDRIDIAALVGGFEMLSKMLFYYFHERLWNKISFGRKTVEPFVLWFTGLSGSGKSTLANAVYEHIRGKGLSVERLDGDTVRDVFPQTGFTKEERDNHVRRVGYLAAMLEKNGVVVLSSLISPYRESRDQVRKMCGNFIEVFVDTPLEECEKRDVKGLYKKARSGEIHNFTGIDDPYEAPHKPEIIVKTHNAAVEESARYIMAQLKNKKYLNLNG